jgi:hypothetical protein
VTEDVRAPRVDVDVVQHRAGWAATLTARYPSGATGTRFIETASCAELERAVAVSLSLLDPIAGATPQRASPVPQRSTTVRAAPSVAASETPAPTDRDTSAGSSPREAVSADAGVDAEFAHGSLDESLHPSRRFVRMAALAGSSGGRFMELGGALSGGLWLGRWGGRVEVGTRRALSSVSADRGVSLELTRYVAALDVCARSGEVLHWGLCAGPRLERVAGLASGPSNPASDAVWLPGLGAGIFLRLPIVSRWSLYSELQGSWALRGAEANVRPWGRVYELPRLGGDLLVGIELEI